MALNIVGTQNQYQVPSVIAREALYRVKHKLILGRISNKTYNQYLTGDKIGDTISVKRPVQMKASEGRRVNIQSMIDKIVEIKINKEYNIALEVSAEDVALHIVDYGDRYLETAAEELAYWYDIVGFNELADGFFLMNGTPGTALNLRQAQDITAHADKMAIPMGMRSYAILDPLDVAEISGDVHDVNMPEMVEGTIRKRYRGMLADWHVLSSTHMPYLQVAAVPTAATPLVMGANQRGSTLNTDGWTNTGTKVLNKGQLIQIANVYEVQPRGDRRRTGNIMTFTVTADVTPNASGVAAIPIYPEINAGTSSDTITNPSGLDFDRVTADTTIDASAFQTVSNVPADNSAITVVGRSTSVATSREFRQGAFFCGDALEYVNVALPKPKSSVVAGVDRDPETGVAVTYLADFNILEYSEIERLDIWFGAKNIYPEIGILHVGAQV